MKQKTSQEIPENQPTQARTTIIVGQQFVLGGIPAFQKLNPPEKATQSETGADDSMKKDGKAQPPL